MKVSGTKSGGVSKAGGKTSAPAGRTPRKNQDKVDAAAPVLQHMGGDALEVSDHLTTVEIIRNLVQATPDVRTGDVERISNQLKNGSYKIDYEKVAEAFIREVIVNEIARRPRKK
jgi:flagellar biosynthesis anti-sigma factor FlgM